MTGSGDRQRGAELAAQTRWMLPLFGRQFGCLLLSLVHVPASLPQYGFPVPVCVLCIILFLVSVWRWSACLTNVDSLGNCSLHMKHDVLKRMVSSAVIQTV